MPAPEPTRAPDGQPRWWLVLNGKAAGNDALRDAIGIMRRRGVDLQVRVTWEAGDVGRYVAEALRAGVDTLVAAGGDGTLSALATTLAQRDEPAAALPSLGLVPLGTANDFAVAADIPMDPLDALELVRVRAALPVDLLRIEVDGDDPHWCANLASGGFGTQVTVETSEGLKKMLGGLAYLITGMSRLGRIDPVEARLVGEDAEGARFAWQGGFIALGLGNGRQAGGGQALCPEAMIDDGLFDLTVVPSLEGEVGSTIATLVAEGRHAALDRVAERRRLRTLVLESDTPFTLNLDGEPVSARRFVVACVPGRVRVHLPEGSPLLLGTIG